MSEFLDNLDTLNKIIKELREANKQLYEKYVDLLFDYLVVKVKLEELEGKTNDDSARAL